MNNSKLNQKNKEGKTGQIIRIEQAQLTRHLDQVVRGTVEETLNALLDAEADKLCQTGRSERSEERKDTRAGHYNRKPDTKVGQVQLKVPKLRTLTFETAIIERYRRRTRVVGAFPDGQSALMLVAARLRHVSSTKWGTRRYLNMERLTEAMLEIA